VRALAHHLGEIHRWARLAVVTEAPPDPSLIDAPPPAQLHESEALVMWMSQGLDALVTALGEREAQAPSWSPFTVARTVGFWRRRQGHELAIHRWDLEHAVGGAGPFPPAQAADHIGEYFEVIVPRVIDRDGKVAPIGSITVELIDAGTSFQVVSDGYVVSVGEAVDGAERIRGTASDVLLALWGRQTLHDAPDAMTAPTAAAWLRYGGN
jgi:uncharacterized protein (TIGR03083 family)